MRSIRPKNVLTKSFALFLATVVLTLPACDKGDEEVAAEQDAEVQEAPEPGPPLDVSTLPEIVASVNGEEIAKETLIRQAAGRRQQMIQGGFPPMTEDATFYRDVLDQIVGGILLAGEAGTLGLEAPAAEVEQQIAQIRGGFPDEASFVAALQSQDTTPDELTESIQQELSIRRLVNENVMTKINITDEDKKLFYEENLDRMKQPAQVRVRHILIPVAQDAGAEAKAEALTKANGLKEQITSGGDFAELAKANSADTTSAQLGGELPWIGPGQTVPPFEQTSYSLAPGEVSDPVETRFGYHIIELLERKEESVLPFEQVEPRIGQVLQEEQLRARIDDLVEGLKGKASIEIFM